MINDLPLPTILAETETAGEPTGLSFIHEKTAPTGGFASDVDRFNFWEPFRYGDHDCDYAAGAQHFAAALTFARENKMMDLFAYVVSHMCAVGMGAIELGFIDAMAAKATYGAMPEGLSDETVGNYARLFSCGIEEIRQGEVDAREFLTIAREGRCPELIQGFLTDIVERKSTFGVGTIPFLSMISRAAYLGAAN